MKVPRSKWGTTTGFILAAAGSAIGVGNLWKFPYITWENNGGAFVIIYLVCAAIVGLPILTSELIIGRKTQLSAVPAMRILGSETWGGKSWKLVGWLGVLGSAFILSYVSVIAGWAMAYVAICLKWSFSGFDESHTLIFSEFISHSKLQLILSLAFSIVTAFIVQRGIGRGIEKANRILMPALFLMLIGLLAYSFTLEGFKQSAMFLFRADFSNISTQSVLEAMGQAFFSLSLGMGIMITYGSYLKSSTSLTKAAIWVVTMDTLVAIVASMIMYSIIFTFPSVEGSLSGSTTGMLFTTLPSLFYSELPGGIVLGPLFYLLVTFAALSSTISLLEVVAALLIDQFKISRTRSTGTAAIVVYLLSVLVIFSLNPESSLSRFQFFGTSESGFLYKLNQIVFRGKAGFMTVLDHLVANWMLPLTGLLTTLFVGWFLAKDISLKELKLYKRNRNPGTLFYGFLILARFVAPAAIIYILFNIVAGNSDFT